MRPLLLLEHVSGRQREAKGKMKKHLKGKEGPLWGSQTIWSQPRRVQISAATCLLHDFGQVTQPHQASVSSSVNWYINIIYIIGLLRSK